VKPETRKQTHYVHGIYGNIDKQFRNLNAPFKFRTYNKSHQYNYQPT